MHILSIARFDAHTNENNTIQEHILNLPKPTLSSFVLYFLHFLIIILCALAKVLARLSGECFLIIAVIASYFLFVSLQTSSIKFI